MKLSFLAPPRANASINDAVDGVLSRWTSSRISASSRSSPIVDRSDVRVFSTLEKTLSGSAVVTGRTARIRSREYMLGKTTREQLCSAAVAVDRRETSSVDTLHFCFHKSYSPYISTMRVSKAESSSIQVSLSLTTRTGVIRSD